MSETAAVQSAPPRKEIRNDRLLSLKDVEEITGMCSRVASELMNETGGAFMLRNQKFVFESAFYDFLRGADRKRRGGMMAAPLPSAYLQSVEHLLDDLPSIFVGDKGRIPIHPLPLQQALHGLRDELVLVHGPGGIGKSDLGLNIALGALAEASVVYMSLELSSKAIMRRLLPLESALNDYDSRIDAEEFTEIELLPPVRREYVQQIVSQTRRTCCSLSIVDDAFTPGEFTGRTVEELRRAVHQRRARGEDVLVVVDYVQLLSLEEPCFTSTDHIDKVSRCLASIAHTEQVPVIAISAVGKDGSIRGSSMLQHDADIVLKMIEDEDDGEFRTVRLLFEKWREGVAGSCVTLTYAPAHHLFF